MSTFVDIALGIPQDEPYQYKVPEMLAKKIQIGRRSKVPLGSQTRFGYIVGMSDSAVIDGLKPIKDIIDPESFITDNMLQLAKDMSERYFCSWGQAIESIMPAPFKRGKTTMKSRTSKAISKDEKNLIHATPDHDMTEMQTVAFETMAQGIGQNEYQSFLLHGVTGSGKTEIYLKLIEKLIAMNQGSIVLVPEISLTPQTTQRFQSRFGDTIAVIHSRISQGKRMEEWHRIRSGEAKVVVGARSAVFSPVKNLGLIVIDEEHDDSYKQDETPRYETHWVARRRCELEEATLLRASATPSLESFYDTQIGQATYVNLPERIHNRPMPKVQIIDMRQEKAGKRIRIFSIALENEMRYALDRKEQIILLMNRRGYSPYVHCATCGYVVQCPQCRVSMVYHHGREGLLCHTCDWSKDAPDFCPSCNKGKLHYFGIGTEKLEAETMRLFPDARIERMDKDNTTTKGSHDRILGKFRKREVDILLGTQMIAKGHDFPGVSVIGVISADTALNLPDFRSAERTFDLLTQVAGRAGREDIPGKVFIQTFIPEHYSIKKAKNHDYMGFYENEIKYRKALNMPPFTNLIQLVFSGKVEKEVLRQALELKKVLEFKFNATNVIVLGPAPCVVSKRHGLYLWNIYLKVTDILTTNDMLRQILKTFPKRAIKITVDVNAR